MSQSDNSQLNWRRDHIRALIDIRRDTNIVSIFFRNIQFPLNIKLITIIYIFFSGTGTCCEMKRDDIGIM
jgi:hypothetical protein